MGFWNTIKDVGSAALAPVSGGLSLVGMSEDTMSGIPLLGPLTGAQSDEQKALIAKQKEMAEEARKRQRLNHEARMSALGQQMLAFDPMNQTMAKMFGPGAAFQPEQLANMAKDPMKPQLDPSLYGFQGIDPKKEAEINAYMAQMDDYKAKEAKRREFITSNMRPLPGAAAPLQQRAPAPARRY